MAYFDHVTIFLLVNCEIQGEFLLALPIVCNSYVQNIFRGACNAIRGDLQEFADFSKQILGRLPIAFNQKLPGGHIQVFASLRCPFIMHNKGKEFFRNYRSRMFLRTPRTYFCVKLPPNRMQ